MSRAIIAAWIAMLLVPAAHAQRLIAPVVGGSIGLTQVRTRAIAQTDPPGRTFDDGSLGVAMGLSAGLRFGPFVTLDANIRGATAGHFSLMSYSAGPALQIPIWARRVVRARAGVGRVTLTDQNVCAMVRCRGYAGDFRDAMDASVSVDARDRSTWAGLLVWWTQSTAGVQQYRSVGVGAQVRGR